MPADKEGVCSEFDVDLCGIVFFIVHVIGDHGTHLYNQWVTE